MIFTYVPSCPIIVLPFNVRYCLVKFISKMKTAVQEVAAHLVTVFANIVVTELLVCLAGRQQRAWCPDESRRGPSTSRSKLTSRRRKAECRLMAGVCQRKAK